MSILNSIRNSIIVNLAKAVDSRIDGRKTIENDIRPAVYKILKSEKDTEKLLRGPVSNFIRELYEGIWMDKTNVSLERWQHQINKKS